MPEDIIELLVVLLFANWDNSNTSSITPPIGAGYLDPQEAGAQAVYVENVTNEDATGTSGVHGINPGSGSPVQLLRGMVFIDCVADSVEGQPDPDDITDEFVREIQRIVMANINSVAGYDYVSFLGYNRIPPSKDRRPWDIRRSCRIGFQWRYTP